MSAPSSGGSRDPPCNVPGNARLRALFDAALEQPPERRAAWLCEHVADAQERAHIERLLAADAAPGALDIALDERVASLGAEPAAPADGLIGHRIGAFRLTRLLGQGGMATVFLGERTDADFRQEVAVKLLRRGLYTEFERRLFRRERQALATLSHPNIARLIDGGVTEAGIPYLVLEYVEGLPVTAYAARNGLGLRDRLLLFVAVCQAVADAHRHLIVHRDLKPSNILVTGEGNVKLLDFGIAKLLAEDGTDTTRTGQAALTPGYAAPEQLSGTPVSTATDVYALGVLLYELLLGERPAVGAPGRPSARVDSRSAEPDGAAAPRAALVPALRGDLDSIVLKALAEEPERRYASAGALADDIERHLRLEPVSAHPPSAWYQTRKFIRRHRGGVAATALLSLGLFVSLALAVWQTGVAREQARLAQQQAQRANTVRDFVESLFRSVRIGVARDQLPGVDELVAQGVETLQADTRLGPAERVDLLMMFARLHDNLGETGRGRELGLAADELATRTLDPLHSAAIGALALRGIQAVRSFDHAAGAAPLLEAARRARATGDETLIEVLDNLAMIEMDRGDPIAALALEREALDERIQRFGAEDERTAAGWNNLGYGLTGVGRYEEAAEAYRQTWEIDRRHLPTDSYDVLSSLSNWGWALTQAGQVREGARRIADAEQGFQRLGGKPRYMHALNALKLCNLQHEFGDANAAEPVCARMLALAQEQAGDPSFLLGLAWRQEALRRMERGDLDGAAAALEDADSQFQDGQEYARGRFGVLQVGSFIWWLKGEAATARDFALEALEMRPPTQEVNLLRLRAVLALACAAAPDDRCGSPADRLESAMRTVANPGHPRLLLPATALARLRLQAGDAGNAAALLDDAMQASAVELGRDHPQWRAAQLWRALALARQGDCAAAYRHHREALDGAGDSGSPWLREARVAWLARNMCKDT